MTNHYLRPALAMPQIFLYRAPIDFRKQVNGLAALIEQELGHDPFNVFALTTVYATKPAAMRAATAKWNKLQRGVAEFSLTLAMGRADLYPETPVTVKGFKSVIDEQEWIISKVTHSLSNSGYTTSLELEVLLNDVGYNSE